MTKIILEGQPISVNALYTGRRFLTPKARQIKDDYGWQVMQQWKKPVTTKNIEIEVNFYFNSQRWDIDNCLKGLLDTLTGVIWEDDKQIMKLTATKNIDKERPRVELKIKQ